MNEQRRVVGAWSVRKQNEIQRRENHSYNEMLHHFSSVSHALNAAPYFAAVVFYCNRSFNIDFGNSRRPMTNLSGTQHWDKKILYKLKVCDRRFLTACCQLHNNTLIYQPVANGSPPCPRDSKGKWDFLHLAIARAEKLKWFLRRLFFVLTNSFVSVSFVCNPTSSWKKNRSGLKRLVFSSQSQHRD